MNKKAVGYLLLAGLGAASFYFGLQYENQLMTYVGLAVGALFGFLFEFEIGAVVGFDSLKKPNKYEKKAIRQALLGAAIAIPATIWFVVDYGNTGVAGTWPMIAVWVGVIIMAFGAVNSFSGWLERPGGIVLPKKRKK